MLILQRRRLYIIEALKKLSQIQAGFDVTYDFSYNDVRVKRADKESPIPLHIVL